MRVRLAVFDLIGTTVRSGDEVPSSFRGAFSEVGIALSDEAIAAARGRSKVEAVADLLRRSGVAGGDLPQLSETVYASFRKKLREALRSAAKPIPGSEAVFRFLTGAGIKVVLTTGLDRETAQDLISAVGWRSADFTGVISGEDVARGRPAPDLIHAAMEAAQATDPGAVLAVGDTTADLEAAANAGVGWSVGVLTGAHSRARLEASPHTVILRSVADLPDWMARAGLIQAEPESD